MSDALQRTWIVNGARRSVRFEPLARLLDLLREQLDLISLKEGCGEGECGACSVIIDGELHAACLVAAAQLDDGAEILTAEGLGASAAGRSLQAAFDDEAAVQCGYCSPAMLLGAHALLSENRDPSEGEIRAALAGHLCRCTGYNTIVRAVRAAASGAAGEGER